MHFPSASRAPLTSCQQRFAPHGCTVYHTSCVSSLTRADLVSKSAALKVDIKGVPVHIGGMCKGSGMIHPNMATMLGVVTCDASVAPDAWREMVRRASTASFNQITVCDTHTHTHTHVCAAARSALQLAVLRNPINGLKCGFSACVCVCVCVCVG